MLHPITQYRMEQSSNQEKISKDRLQSLKNANTHHQSIHPSINPSIYLLYLQRDNMINATL